MKKFLKGVVEWKTSACMIFTAAVFIYLFFCLIYDTREVPTSMLWGLFWVSAAGSLIQAVCFSDWIIKKMRYTWRSMLFVTLFLPLLSLAAWKLNWFPTQQAGAWAVFIGVFFLIFIVMTVGFEIFFRLTGRKYDGLIGQYRKQREEDRKADR